MFHRARDASKIALVHLVARLKAGRYRLLDTQFVTDHLRTFGAVEVYDGHVLVGGLYGVSLGSTFFGESMFHRARDASKVALVHLIARLKAGRFRLLDTQFVTDHLKTFGATEVSRRQYHKLLDAALIGEADFGALSLHKSVPGSTALNLHEVN